MNMIYHSICLCCLQFLSSVSYSFLSAGFLPSLIPRYFILCDAIVNGIVFLIFLSDSSLSVYRNATVFYILILYPATLPNSLMSSSNFLIASLGFSMYSILLSANSDSFISSFPIWIRFISLSCLITVTSTFNNKLNKSGKSGHPCLVLDLRGNIFSFSTLCVMLAVSLSQKVFIMLRNIHTTPTLSRVVIKMDVEFGQNIFLLLLR